jgi:dodecin
MSVAKVIEIISSSKKSFEDAVAQGVAKAADSLHDITGAWVKEQSVKVINGKVAEYRVNMKVTFVLKDAPKKVKVKK